MGGKTLLWRSGSARVWPAVTRSRACRTAFSTIRFPAVFAVTTDPFIVFSSNLFAILGLRSLYFLLAGMLDRFVYLKVGLAALLVFAGAKILIGTVYEIPIAVSLIVIVAILGIAIGASLLVTRRGRAMSEADAGVAVARPILAIVDPAALVRITAGLTFGLVAVIGIIVVVAMRDRGLLWLAADLAIVASLVSAAVLVIALRRDDRPRTRSRSVRGWSLVAAALLVAIVAGVLVLD